MVSSYTMDHGGPKQPILALKKFTFEDNKKNPPEFLSVSIPEVLDPQYGMYVWPCAAVLAQYVWTHREELPRKTILELGAGVALPGLVAAQCGADVVLSDNPRVPQCLQNCRRSCEANGRQDVAVLGLTWGQISPDLLLLPELDVILGSDVFYDPADFEDVLVTVAFLLRKYHKAQFWTTYEERSTDWWIEPLLHRWKLNCVDIPLDTFDADECELAGSTLLRGHCIHMMVITLQQDYSVV